MREGNDGPLGDLVAQVRALREAGASTVIVDHGPDGTRLRATFVSQPSIPAVLDEAPPDAEAAKRQRDELLEWSSS